ncbi:hypothetical protein ACQ4PT_050311 [Festuca glaucescens]
MFPVEAPCHAAAAASSSTPSHQNTNTSWRAPPSGWIKINTDSSFLGRDLPGGAGAIARDDNGRVIIAACSPISRYSNADDAEAKAALMGIKVLSGMGYSKIILDMDSAAVVSALRAVGPDRSMSWATVDETKKMLKEAYIYRINHVRR